MSDDDAPKSSRQVVSDNVRILLTELVNEDPEVGKSTHTTIYNKKLREMAAYLGMNPEYMPVKVKKRYWSLDDLDKMADFFDIEPGDFLLGPGQREKREHDRD